MDHLERERDYRSRTFNFGGFALMAPFGHIIMDPINVLGKFDFILGALYFIGCFILFLCGCCSIEIGRDILYRRR